MPFQAIERAQKSKLIESDYYDNLGAEPAGKSSSFSKKKTKDSYRPDKLQKALEQVASGTSTKVSS